MATLRTAAAVRNHLAASAIDLECDERMEVGEGAPLQASFEIYGRTLTNRFCILPMEGWDGTLEGEPSALTIRRWRNFGKSGAKLIWGGEAVAVRQDGRANPNQLLIGERTLGSLAALRKELVQAHTEAFGPRAADDLLVGLQLTHSGRFARPGAGGRPEPLVAYAHPVLDRRFPGGVRIIEDDELRALVGDFVKAAVLAQRAGFEFVDVKACHGYLGHELLSAHSRTGPYGGSFENRTRFLREVIAGIRAAAPGLHVASRVSVFDVVPHRPGPDGVGVPEEAAYDYGAAFGRLTADDQLSPALAEARALLRLFESLGVRLVCVSAGSPYYCPHVQRPALFPPSDGYKPPEDPLRGVARLLRAAALLKADFPGLAIVGSGYSYLQEWLPNVAQAVVRKGGADFVGLGRAVLSYPEMAADVLAGRPLRRALLCRTLSDCTTAPRNGLVSGCFPLDRFYSAHPDAARLATAKAALGR